MIPEKDSFAMALRLLEAVTYRLLLREKSTL